MSSKRLIPGAANSLPTALLLDFSARSFISYIYVFESTREMYIRNIGSTTFSLGVVAEPRLLTLRLRQRRFIFRRA